MKEEGKKLEIPKGKLLYIDKDGNPVYGLPSQLDMEIYLLEKALKEEKE